MLELRGMVTSDRLILEQVLKNAALAAGSALAQYYREGRYVHIY